MARRSRAALVAYTAVTTALVYVTTCIAVPMPKPLGVWHMGDVGSFIVAVLFGPRVGAFACGVGAMFFDIWNPLYQSSFIQWAPATLVIRSVMGYIVGRLRRVVPSRPRASEVLAMAVSHVWKNFAYFAYDYALFGPVAYLDLVTFFPLSVIDIAVATAALSALRRYLRVEYVM